MRLKGKTAIITGSPADSKKDCPCLRTEGANVALNSRSADEKTVSTLIQETAKLGEMEFSSGGCER